jgi:hypothetical protein
MSKHNLIPQLEEVNHFKFYNLVNAEWMFDNTVEAINNNRPISEKLAKDFSEYSGINYEHCVAAFNIDYIYTRTTEPLILLYSNHGNDDVHYYLTDVSYETYQVLSNRK